MFLKGVQGLLIWTGSDISGRQTGREVLRCPPIIPLQIKETMISCNTKNLPCNEEPGLVDFPCLNDRSEPFHSS